MTLTLRPDLQAFVDAQVRSGAFRSQADAVESALEQLMLNAQPDHHDMEAISRAEEDFARGDTIDFRDASDALLKKHFGAGLDDE